jgi:hypothetical protein
MHRVPSKVYLNITTSLSFSFKFQCKGVRNNENIFFNAVAENSSIIYCLINRRKKMNLFLYLFVKLCANPNLGEAANSNQYQSANIVVGRIVNESVFQFRLLISQKVSYFPLFSVFTYIPPTRNEIVFCNVFGKIQDHIQNGLLSISFNESIFIVVPKSTNSLFGFAQTKEHSISLMNSLNEIYQSISITFIDSPSQFILSNRRIITRKFFNFNRWILSKYSFHGK